MKITRFEDIEAWKLGRELSLRIYEVVNDSKFLKDYALRDQICRASISVMSNVAEGFNSGSNAEFARFLSYAQRSCSEVQSQLYIALDQNYTTKELFDKIYDLSGKTSSKIGAFIKYLKLQKTMNKAPGTRNEEP